MWGVSFDEQRHFANDAVGKGMYASVELFRLLLLASMPPFVRAKACLDIDRTRGREKSKARS